MTKREPQQSRRIAPDAGARTQGDLPRPVQQPAKSANRETLETSLADKLQGPSCPTPLREFPQVILGHGGGGALTAELIEQVFLPALAGSAPRTLADATSLTLPTNRIAVSTDSFVVQPLFFPGGNIGELAVYGAVNDVAMSGATPLYLTAGFVIEEGFSMECLVEIVECMGRAATRAGVQIVAGDTKVVQRQRGDGLIINTTGIGALPEGPPIAPDRAQSGDCVLLSGTLADHGMAVMSVREGLQFESPIVSDSAPLADLVQRLLATGCELRVLRDPTRGGLAASLHEIADASGCSIVIDETKVPVQPVVQAACEILGLDPWEVANEGKLVAIASAADQKPLLAAMRRHPLGASAAAIGRVTDRGQAKVVARTALGAQRVVTLPLGEILPRIC